MRACIYCSCTDDDACMVTLKTQPRDIRMKINSELRAAGVTALRIPEAVGCSWISTTPPVCSAPDCIAKHQGISL